MYEALLLYKKQHGDCLVPENYSLNPALGAWVHKQRLQHQRLGTSQTKTNKEIKDQKEGASLTLERKERLDCIGFCWNPPTSLVNVKHVEEETMKMAPVTDVGVDFNIDIDIDMDDSFEASTETLDDKKALAYGSQWDYMFDRLVEYKEKKGNTLVPIKTDSQLGQWVRMNLIQHCSVQYYLFYLILDVINFFSA